MDAEPLTVRPDDLLSDVAEEVKDVHYRAAVAVDGRRQPVGLVTRSDLVDPDAAPRAARRPRRAGAERAGRRAGRDRRDPRPPPHRLDRDDACRCTATFDPVGSTATLVIERFRQNGHGAEPRRRRRCCSAAVLSDTVILNSPTTTERDHAVVEYLERVLALDATEFGREMFEETSDVSERRRGRHRRAATPRSTTVGGGPDDLHRPGRDRRAQSCRAPRRAAGGAGAPARGARTTCSTR